MQMGVLQTWIKAQGIAIVMTSQCSGAQIPFTLDFDLTGVLTHLPIVPHICASELGQH